MVEEPVFRNFIWGGVGWGGVGWGGGGGGGVTSREDDL